MEENNLEQNPPVNPIQQPVEPVENKTEAKAPPSTKNKLPLILIIIFVLLIILGLGAYYYLGLQAKNANQQKQTSILPTNVQSSPTSSIDETANWKTYISPEYNPFFSDEIIKKYNQTKQPDGYANDENTKYIQFSIKYPVTWRQEYFDNLVGQLGKNSFMFFNGEYKITVGKGVAPGGNSCNNQKILKEITTQTSGFNLSRVKAFDSDSATFELCEKGGSNTRIGKIIYMIPKNYDSKILDEMDKIISTISYSTILASGDQNQTNSNNKFDISTIKVGDKIGQLVIKSVEPFNSGYSSLSDKNFKITFQGSITLNGQYNIDDGTGMGIGIKAVEFTPDSNSSLLLPQEIHTMNYGYAKSFKFNDYDNAYKLLIPSGKSGTATVIIDNYTLVNYPSEISNTADLVQVK